MAFTPLKPSNKKGKDALRLSRFKLEPKIMTQYGGFDGDALLSCVVPLGDSQISPIFRLGHGIGDGIDRVEQWLSSIEIHAGRVVKVDSRSYETAVSKLMQKHFDALRLYEKDLLAREKDEGAALMGDLKDPLYRSEKIKKTKTGMDKKRHLSSLAFFTAAEEPNSTLESVVYDGSGDPKSKGDC